MGFEELETFLLRPSDVAVVITASACDGNGGRCVQSIETSEGQVVAATWRYDECHEELLNKFFQKVLVLEEKLTEVDGELFEDPKFRESIGGALGLKEDSKRLASPGTKNADRHEGSLPKVHGDDRKYRSIVATINYMATDMPDLQFPCNEACREMSGPTVQSWKKQTIGRYFLGRERRWCGCSSGKTVRAVGKWSLTASRQAIWRQEVNMRRYHHDIRAVPVDVQHEPELTCVGFVRSRT